MFGLEAFIGPLLFKLLGLLAVVGALIATYFGIKGKGKREAQSEMQAQLSKEREVIQARVDAARSEDQVIDQKVNDGIRQVEAEKKPVPVTPYKPGDIFKFSILPLVLSLLLGCAAFSGVTPVKIEIPPHPILIDCPPPPSPEGTIVDIGGKNMVLIPLPDAMGIQTYFRESPSCYKIRELMLDGYIDKLVNRLKALGQ